MCKLSECTEDKFSQLNDAIQGKESACFDLKQIEENLQKNQDRLKEQVEEMVQLVTEREKKIVKEVENVCQKTIEQIKHLAMEIENPMKNDEEILKTFMACNEFQKRSNEEFIKCLFFYNGLKLQQDKYVERDQTDMPFSLKSSDLSIEKIVDLVGCVLSDGHSSSDEDSGNIGIISFLHETNKDDESLPHQYKKHFPELNFDDIVLVSPEKKFLRCEENIFYLSRTNVEKLVECVKHFTYAPATDEIIYVLENQASKILRQPLSIDGEEILLFSLGDEEVLCIAHDAEHYLTILSQTTLTETSSKTFTLNICFINEMGCLMKPVLSNSGCTPSQDIRIKIYKSSFVIIDTKPHGGRITFANGLEFVFSYSGSIGCDPPSTFSPVDVCTDPDGNFIVTDSYDDTVHLLDPKGKFQLIILSAEDGLRGIKCIAMDSLGWLWIGCDEGTMHFANYQYFKSTTRRDRYLEKLKDKEKA